MTELPNLPWTVRNAKGVAVAAYVDKDDAEAHALHWDGWTVTPDQWAAQNPGPRRSPWAAGGQPTGWPYEVHPDTPPSQRVHVIGPRASAWVNVGPSHMEGHCIVAVCRDDTGTRYRAVQGPVWTEAASSDVMPTIAEGWCPVAYVELWCTAAAVVTANITMAHQRDTPNGPS